LPSRVICQWSIAAPSLNRFFSKRYDCTVQVARLRLTQEQPGKTANMTDTPRPREHARRQHERPHVLIITDEPSLATFLSEGLLLGGFWASVVSHGLQVLEVFRLRQFDLIVLDLELGNFDAMELLSRLRGVSERSTSREPRTNAPIVILTSEATVIDPTMQSSLGISATLHAPVELEDVVQTLHHAFEAWRQIYPHAPLADASPSG
jgi:CheY-like chemotaxis protein